MPSAASKRLYTQSTSESLNEPIQVNTVVVIHPGSYNLRIGKASDTFPLTIPHCIARKKKDPSKVDYETPWVSRPECVHSEAKIQMRQGLRSAEEALQGKPMSSGEYRQPTSSKQLYALNCNVKGERTDVQCNMRWTNTDRQPPYIVGEEALYIHRYSGYSLHWPMRMGRLNIHDGPGGTLSSVLADLEVIWSEALQTMLNIPLKDLKLYKVLLLIPDVYVHKHVKEMTSLLLERLGFGSVIVHQESACATFGSGVSSACVVDVGDQKTSICCVEDGISHKNTRITMEYGGSDITRTLHWLMGRSGFSSKDVNLNDITDAVLMQGFKETLCHLDHDQDGAHKQSLQIKKPSQTIVKYNVTVGDELILSPMSLFFPDMFGLHGDNLIHVQKKFAGDPDDPHDEFYLRQIQSAAQQSGKLSKKKDITENRDSYDANLSMLDDSQSQAPGQMDEDSNDAPDVLASSDVSKVVKKTDLEEEQEQEAEPVMALMGIDQAILKSIERCGSDELKKKMYSCIVVVGGGLKFEGAQHFLQYRIWVGMPPQYRLMLETMDVITRPKEMDPQLTCWKGAALLACLDTTQELWISQKEWKQFSVRMLRERAPFMW